MSIAATARKHGINPTTISRRIRREGWQRDAAKDDPLSSAAHLYRELSEALRSGLTRLAQQSDCDEEHPGSAQERAQLIRAHRRALVALVEAERSIARLTEGRPSRRGRAPPRTTLDLDAARREVLSRLDRLAALQPEEG